MSNYDEDHPTEEMPQVERGDQVLTLEPFPLTENDFTSEISQSKFEEVLSNLHPSEKKKVLEDFKKGEVLWKEYSRQLKMHDEVIIDLNGAIGDNFYFTQLAMGIAVSFPEKNISLVSNSKVDLSLMTKKLPSNVSVALAMEECIDDIRQRNKSALIIHFNVTLSSTDEQGNEVKWKGKQYAGDPQFFIADTSETASYIQFLLYVLDINKNDDRSRIIAQITDESADQPNAPESLRLRVKKGLRYCAHQS